MVFRTSRSVAAVATILFSGLATSQATAICVNPNRASCEATIQDAVDIATAGDRISVASGVYFENVAIPPGLDGLTISGRRSAILDPGDDGLAVAPNTGDGIEIGSNDVTIRGITIRNGNDNHITLLDLVTGTSILSVRSVNADSDFVNSDTGGNDDTTIRGCQIFAGDSSAADLTGNRVEFIRNDVRQMSSEGVDISGDDAIVERNVFVGIENGDAVRVSGNGAEIVRNRINATDDAGIDVDGNDALVRSNRLAGTYGGIEVNGERPVVKNNRVAGTVSGGESIDVTCNVDCTGAMVVGNRTVDVGDDTYSFEIDANAAGMLIANNSTREGIDTGFDLSIDGATVRSNRVKGVGGDGEDCFDIDGDDNIITRNSAQLCMGNGFSVDGTGNMLEYNRVYRAAEDGFDVAQGSVNTTLNRNRATENGLTGFRIRDGGTPATGTTLTGNRATRSRYDLCDEGVSTTRSGNSFGSELAVTQDGTADCPTF